MDKQVEIRHASVADLDAVMAIYDYARQRMAEGGNPSQWVDGYPSREIISADIDAGNSYVIESDGVISGVFTFIVGDDPSYAEIDGAWPDNSPYGTIHRIAAAPGVKGVADTCLDYCLTRGVNIRIDTHSDNLPMLGWIEKRGFLYCGIIRVANGTPRRAFQLTRG